MTSAAPNPRPSGMRGDIEGMRAIAVGMVLLYHAQVPGVVGGFAGVDVFFVISGFLITSLLIREIDRSGTISILGFYARRARRLLPAATVVLLFVAISGPLVLSASVRADLGRDILGSTFYVVNWVLAARSVDYLAEDNQASALQHYWSLSVEEQFYVIWPLLMIFAVIVARRSRISRFHLMGALMVAITGVSLLYSIVHTGSSPGTAYFISTTRVWELGVGALLALALPGLQRLSRATSQITALVGLVAVGLSAVMITSETPWPGSAALLPVLGTAAVIAAGCAHTETLVGRLLGVAPMRFIGGLSYSLYLWHWPLLVFAEEMRPNISLIDRIVIVVAAVVLAYLTKRFIEDPIRFNRKIARKPRAALLGAGVAMTATTAAAVALVLSTPTLADEAPTAAVGAEALAGDVAATDEASVAVPTSGPVYPAPALAPEDVPELYTDDCQVPQDSTDVVTCDYGDTTADRVIALVGDSKVGQWLPAFDEIGQEQNFVVRTYTKSACTWTDATLRLQNEPYDDCQAWGQRVKAELLGGDQPSVVVVSGGSDKAIDAEGGVSTSALVEGYEQYWKQVVAAGIPVVALADNPHPGFPVYECVEDHPDDFGQCDFEAREGGGTPALREATSVIDGASMIDLTDRICLKERCPAVIGGVLVYRQGSHITATYARTLRADLEAELLPLIQEPPTQE